MGYAIATVQCVRCESFFTCNPLKVPVIVDDKGGRHPICKGCVEYLNPLRKQLGLQPLVYPEDAYSSACREEELGS